MIDAILRIAANISGWFSPEQRAKAKREKRSAIKKELRQLKKRKWTPELGKKMERLQNELEKINASLGS